MTRGQLLARRKATIQGATAMSIPRTLIGVILIVACVIPASSALAAYSGATNGGAENGKTTFAMPGGTLECEKSKEEYVQTPTEDHVLMIVYTNCVFVSSGGLVKTTATVGCNELLFEQPSKEGTLTGKATVSIPSECTIKSNSGCVVSIPTTGNQKLGKATAKKEEGPQVLSNVALTGVTAKANATCAAEGLKSTTEGKFEDPKLIQKGISLI
jgi:hypothetical protein